MKVLEAKLVTVGEYSVGKTSLVKRYVEKSFDPSNPPTIGATFLTTIINIDDVQIRLNIWDTAGEERFKAITPLYYRGANAVLMVYDSTSSESFAYVKSVYKDLKVNCDENFVIALVANKVDLAIKRIISEDEGREYASLIGASYYETSALQNTGLDGLFETMAANLLKLINEGKTTNMIINTYLTNLQAINLENENDGIIKMCCCK